jgi:hypothetical protein
VQVIVREQAVKVGREAVRFDACQTWLECRVHVIVN